MDGVSFLIVGAAIYGTMSGIVIYAVKKIVETAIGYERDDRIREDESIWNALNEHGHKGLNGNGARVTR